MADFCGFQHLNRAPTVEDGFENPKIGDNFLCDFLEGKESWNEVAEDRRAYAIAFLARNARMKAPYEGPMDGWAEYSHSKVFDEAWMLAERVPTNYEWAGVLYLLLGNTILSTFSLKQPLETANRWQLPNGDARATENELSSNKFGHLGSFQSVRMHLGRLAVRDDTKATAMFLESDDIALRCAAYREARLSEEQIKAAYKRDKLFSVNYALYNDELWRREETRAALHDIAWQAVGEDKTSDLLAANMFNERRDYMVAKNPNWFADDERPEASSEAATRADVAEGFDRISQACAALTGMSLAIDGLSKNLAGVSTRLGWVFWFSLGALAVALGRHF
jgi:hypothetical protein